MSLGPYKHKFTALWALYKNTLFGAFEVMSLYPNFSLMKNFPSSYPTDHYGPKADSRQYALPVRDQTVSYRRKSEFNEWSYQWNGM